MNAISSHPIGRSVFSLIAALAGVLCLPPSHASAQTSCPNAHPDGSDSYAALQACLDAGGTVTLTNGSPGYFTSQMLQINVPGTTLTSSAGYARIYPPTSFWGRILEVHADNVTISFIWFDGRKALRDQSPCPNSPLDGVNVRVQANSFTMDTVISENALCGSGMEVEGANLSITNSWFRHNGVGEWPTWSYGWADGLTVWGCYGGTISNNVLEENTDVDLIVGAGNCQVSNNQIYHTSRKGIAGLGVNWFPSGNGNHAGMSYSGNTVSSQQDGLSFGLMVGTHPWDFSLTIADAGSVGGGGGNSSSGAVANLAVDGVSAGTVQANTFSNARGMRGFPNCNLSADYTAAHFGSASYQPGSICRYYDSDGPCVTVNPPDPCPAVR